MNWQPLLDVLVVFIAGVLAVTVVPMAPIVGVMILKRLRLDVAQKRLQAYSQVYADAVAYGNQLKRDPLYPTVTSGPDAQKAAVEFAKQMTEFVNLPEPDWDLRRMLTDAEYGKKKEAQAQGPLIQTPVVNISPSQPPPSDRP